MTDLRQDGTPRRTLGADPVSWRPHSMRVWLAYRDLTLKDLALYLVVSERTMQRWSRGVYAPSANQVRLIAKKLDCPAHALGQKVFLSHFKPQKPGSLR